MKITEEELRELEVDGARVTRKNSAPEMPAEPVPEPKPAEPSAATKSMAAMSATLEAMQRQNAVSQEMSRQLIEQSTAAINALKERPLSRDMDFEIVRDDTVEGEYKPIKQIRARAAKTN